MKFHLNLLKVARSLLPYKTLHCLEVFYVSIERIAVARDATTIGELNTMFAFQVVCLVYFAVLCWWPPQDQWSRLCYFDYYQLLKIPPIYKLQYTCLIPLAIYYTHVVYFQSYHYYCFQVGRQTVLERKCSFLFNTVDKIVVVTVRAYNLLQIFHIFAVCWCLATYMLIVAEFRNYSFSWWWVAGLVQMHFFACIAFGSLICFVKVTLLAATLGVHGSLIFFMRMNLINRVLDAPMVHKKFNLLRLLKYRRLHIETMRYLFSISKVYGNVLFSFLLTNSFMNSTLITTIFLGNLSWLQAIFYQGFVFGQQVAFILLHINAANFTKRMHERMNRFMSLQLVANQSGSLVNRLKVAHFIYAFHVNKRYGITYASFGLVSMWAFTKFLCLFGELLMFEYNMYR